MTGVQTCALPISTRLPPEGLFCFKYERTVGADNTVQLGEHRLQLLPGRNRVSYVRCNVEVHERIDGSLGVYYQGEQLASQSAPMEAPVLRARQYRRPLVQDSQEAIHRRATQARQTLPFFENGRPTAQHPWRRYQPAREDKIAEPIGGQNR